jgi:micrococcal nuclease
VTDVVDGDTVTLDISGRSERVRLLGIDAPETVAPGRPVECHGPEASTMLAELLPSGTEVEVTRDIEARDRYGRLLLHLVRSSDGLHVNRHMVAEGHARVLAIEPNVAHSRDFAAAADAARRSRSGLWGRCRG